MLLFSLSKEDLDRCVSGIPTHLQDLMREYGPSLVVAGGYIRALVAGEKPSDIDVWCRSEGDAAVASVRLANAIGASVHSSANSHTLRRPEGVPIQFINQWVFESPEAVIDSFDFTIAQAGFWWDADRGCWQSGCSGRFYPDLAERRLEYTAPVRKEAAAGSLFRVFKFYKRGYSITLESLSAVMARATKGVVSPDDLLATLREAGRRLPAPPRAGQETTDDCETPDNADFGAGSG